MSEAKEEPDVRPRRPHLDSDLRRLLPFGGGESLWAAPSSVESLRGINTHEIARLQRKLSILGNLLEETNHEICSVHPPRTNSHQQRDIISNLLDLAVSKPPSPGVSAVSSPRHPLSPSGPSQTAVEDSICVLQQEVRRQNSRIAFLEQRLAQATVNSSPAAEAPDDRPQRATSPPVWPGRSLALDQTDLDGPLSSLNRSSSSASQQHCSEMGACVFSTSPVQQCCGKIGAFTMSRTADVAGGDAAAGASKANGAGGLGIRSSARSPSPLPFLLAAPTPQPARCDRVPVLRPSVPSSESVTPRLARSATVPTVGVDSPRPRRMLASASASNFRIPGDRLGASAAVAPFCSTQSPSRMSTRHTVGGGLRTPVGSEIGTYVPPGFASATSIALFDRTPSASSLSGSIVGAGRLSPNERQMPRSVSSSSMSAGPSVSRQLSAFAAEQQILRSTPGPAPQSARLHSQPSPAVPAWESTTGTP